MKKLIIFDLDGTLLNTIADLANCTNHALSICNFPTHPTEAYNFFVGNGINKLFERALPEGEKTEDNIAKIRQLFIGHYNIHNTDYSSPYPGIILLLERLQEENKMIAVASNKYQEATSKLVRHYFPAIRFVSVLGQREGIPAKPAPNIVFETMLAAGITQKSEVLYVGDSGVDMQTAHNAEVTAVGVTWGFRPKEELLECKADHIVGKAEEVLQLALSL